MSDPQRNTILLGFPGPSMTWGVHMALKYCTRRHYVWDGNSGGSWDNFNVLWCRALNAAEAGDITHFAMLHGDVEPVQEDEGGDGKGERWLDILSDVMLDRGVSLVSTAIPIKDNRGLTSCGLGQINYPWQPYRRLTMLELMRLPETFDADDLASAGFGPSGLPLLHNNGCWLADLRDPRFFATDDDGWLLPMFAFPRACRRDAAGEFQAFGESEDWYFSRRLWEIGVSTCVTRAVRVQHRGSQAYPNWAAWGTYKEGDEDNRGQWDARPAELAAAPEA